MRILTKIKILDPFSRSKHSLRKFVFFRSLVSRKLLTPHHIFAEKKLNCVNCTEIALYKYWAQIQKYPVHYVET